MKDKVKMKQIQTSLAGLNNLKAQSTGCLDGLRTSSCESEDLCFTSLVFQIVTKKEGVESNSRREKRACWILVLY
jgi:hypothetical protein